MMRNCNLLTRFSALGIQLHADYMRPGLPFDIKLVCSREFGVMYLDCALGG